MIQLSKWYLDCVSEAGDVAIGYNAWVQAVRLPVRYEGLVHRSSGWQPKSTHSLRPSSISVSGNELKWGAPGLGVRGVWRRASNEIRTTLYQCPEGAVEWQCLMPKAVAEIELPGAAFGGLGYVERLRISFSPWRVPIRLLRWGRFLSSRNVLVWIDWQGGFSTRFAYLNGQRVRVEPGSIENDHLSLPDGLRATFERTAVLRDASLGATFLEALPVLERVAPARFLLAQESKWLSRTTLEVPGEAKDEGWTIHEEVRWP